MSNTEFVSVRIAVDVPFLATSEFERDVSIYKYEANVEIDRLTNYGGIFTQKYLVLVHGRSEEIAKFRSLLSDRYKIKN